MNDNKRFNRKTSNDEENLIYAGDLSKYGTEFQVKLVSLLIKDRNFAFSILPILKEDYFSDIYLKKIYQCIDYHIKKYTSQPTVDNIKITLQEKKERIILYEKILDNINSIDLSDRDFVMDHSRRFCFTKFALLELEKQRLYLEEGNIELAKKCSIEAYKYSGLDSKKIYDLKEDYEKIFQDDILHRPVPLPFDSFNTISKGGPGAGNLIISVAPSNFEKLPV